MKAIEIHFGYRTEDQEKVWEELPIILPPEGVDFETAYNRASELWDKFIEGKTRQETIDNYYMFAGFLRQEGYMLIETSIIYVYPQAYDPSEE